MKEFDVSDLGINVPKKGQFRKGFKIALPANTKAIADTITIPTERGPVVSIGFVPTGSTDLKDYQNVKFTINNNINILEDETLAEWAPDYARGKINTIPCVIDEGGTLNYTFDNDSAVALEVVIYIYFWNPKKPSYYFDNQRAF